MRLTIKRAALLVMAAALVFCTLPGSARANSVTDTIGIYIGYFGWDTSQYMEKATYTWSELDDLYGGALDTHEVVYSYYSGSRTYLAAARGFYIRDLMEYAGIDFSSIASMDFFTRDQTAGSYRSFTKYSLFDLPRYYFPNLAADEETGAIYAYDGDDIWNGAQRVEAMLALEDYTEWDAVGSEFEGLYSNTMFSASSRFHLFFGQAGPEEANTSSAAKYIYKILVTFSGAPVLTTAETNIDLKVGSAYSVSVDVSAEDMMLDEYVRQNLTWSSSDESVATVDAAGNLTVKGQGETVVTASFGSSSVSVTVKVSDTEAGGSGGSGGGQGTGGASGQTGASSPEDAQQEQLPSSPQPTQEVRPEPTPEPTAAPTVEPEEEKASAFEVSENFAGSDKFAAWVASVLQSKPQGSEGGSPELEKDAQQLEIVKPESVPHAALIGGTVALFLILGFLFGILRYRKQMRF